MTQGRNLTKYQLDHVMYEENENSVVQDEGAFQQSFDGKFEAALWLSALLIHADFQVRIFKPNMTK